MTREGRSGKSQGSDEFQPARHLAASLAPCGPGSLRLNCSDGREAGRSGFLSAHYGAQDGPGPVKVRESTQRVPDDSLRGDAHGAGGDDEC